MGAIILGVVVLGLVISYLRGLGEDIEREKQLWNKGICPYCGEEWYLTAYTHKLRLYRCKNKHKCIITYNIDK